MMKKYAVGKKMREETENVIFENDIKNELEDTAKRIADKVDEQIINELDKLTDDERVRIFKNYCRYCGDKNPGCQCWNDE